MNRAEPLQKNLQDHELLEELALTRLGKEVLVALGTGGSGPPPAVTPGDKLAAYVACVIADLYDQHSTSEQNRMRVGSNLEMAADRLSALARQLQATERNEKRRSPWRRLQLQRRVG